MPGLEAPCVELGSVPQTPSVVASPSPSEISSASSPEPPHIRATPLFRALAMPPPEPDQPPGQEELERRLPGYRRIVIPRELTLIELLKQSSGVRTDDEVLQIREAKLKVVAERVGLRRLEVLAPRLRSLTLDGSAISSLRDLGIGLVHLKVLSVNRCGLYSLDGVWGLGALRELSAAGNRLSDLQPLAALQKLHTLNVSENPIQEAGRLWTLGVCGSLRRLTMVGTPASDELHYRSEVASALPMLVYLDDRPMHNDVDYDSDGLFGVASSESGESDVETDHPKEQPPPAEPDPGPSGSCFQLDSIPPDLSPEDAGDRVEVEPAGRVRRFRRPATTEGAGLRPCRPDVPRRPRTALERPSIDAPTRLQILNTLMDDEWRCSGSKLTSQSAVCGNLAHALRRSNTSSYQRRSLDLKTPRLYRSGNKDAGNEFHSFAVRMMNVEAKRFERTGVMSTIYDGDSESLIEASLEDATRALAAEIPRAPVFEDWIKFKEETGIEIDIDFNTRSNDIDPSKAIERLEQIEKETIERFRSGGQDPMGASSYAPINFTNIMSDFEQWKANITTPEPKDVDSLFRDLNVIEQNLDGNSDISESRSE